MARQGELYQYTADLLCLDACRDTGLRAHPLLQAVHTPLVPSAWESALRNHPDRAFVRLLLRGLTQGFRIGCCPTAPLRSAPRNMLSALQHPEVVRTYLTKECALMRMLGPFPPATATAHFPRLQINRFGRSGLFRRVTTPASGA